jgi:hypothetical protein
MHDPAERIFRAFKSMHTMTERQAEIVREEIEALVAAMLARRNLVTDRSPGEQDQSRRENA